MKLSKNVIEIEFSEKTVETIVFEGILLEQECEALPIEERKFKNPNGWVSRNTAKLMARRNCKTCHGTGVMSIDFPNYYKTKQFCFCVCNKIARVEREEERLKRVPEEILKNGFITTRKDINK